MGLLSIIRKQKIKDRELRVLVLGLDNAGKTTIVKQILGENTNDISPTMGFQISTVFHNNYTLNIWDIGGQTSLRSFWGNYFDKTNVVVWVIDALAMERLQESYQELRDKVILQDRLIGVSLLILVNKVDLVADQEQLRHQVHDMLHLNELVNLWQVQLVSGKTGQGIDEALNWCTN